MSFFYLLALGPTISALASPSIIERHPSAYENVMSNIGNKVDAISSIIVTVTETIEACNTGTAPQISTAQPPPATTTNPGVSCPTDLSGDYEFPHLIVPIDSSKPDTAEGTSLFGTVSDMISSIFNFDIPTSDAGKTCSLVFLFPKVSNLQTSSYTFSGDGKIDISRVESPATAKTTFNNAPDVAEDLDVLTLVPGNSYRIATFGCPAGERVGYKVSIAPCRSAFHCDISNAGSTDLHYFQDYNPPPIGLYITVC